MAILTIQDLHERAGSPDLSHWGVIENFTLLEAALLSAGADPHEPSYEDIEKLQKNRHPNWKHAASFLRSLKEGVCTGEVISLAIYVKSYTSHFGDWEPEQVDLLVIGPGQTADILETMTRISRKTLHDWYKRKYLLRSPMPSIQQSTTRHKTPIEADLVTINPEPTVLSLVAPSYVDPENPLSPIELRAAHDAWNAVTKSGDPKASGSSVRAAIKKYLNEHPEHSKLSADAKDRIATVANWNKKGGATKTPSKPTHLSSD